MIHKTYIQDTDYYDDVDVFNECEQTGAVLLTLDAWEEVHPSLITIPLTEKFANPYGIIYARNCTDSIEKRVSTQRRLYPLEYPTQEIKSPVRNLPPKSAAECLTGLLFYWSFRERIKAMLCHFLPALY